ncbi:transporter substrate-binding domain-containing protein [Massilia sp. YIM B04103]|uniref:substrate-binding periplasmic protein n=1 Tax=Massilia sp. YIM B04103 TaxID=2963106 RepID=UPI00210B3276
MAALLGTLLLAAAARAEERREMVFIAATNHTMPLASFADGKLSGGLLKELGEAIAQRAGRQARFVSVPPRRVASTLAEGGADAVCYVLPEWLDGNFNWSAPLIPDAGVVVARADAPLVRLLSQLEGRPVGTVAGYHYAALSRTLGARFRRDDAPSMEHNIRKLLLGRMQYAVLEKTTFAYLQRKQPGLGLRADLEFDPFKAQCAFSLRSQIDIAEADRAIASLLRDGDIERVLAHYR